MLLAVGKIPTWVGRTIGVEYAKGATTTPLSMSTAGQTLVSVERMVLPASTGVTELATTVGRVRGTPGEELTCVTRWERRARCAERLLR